MNQYELDQVLANHKQWLMGKGGERADLREANLRGADLREANLYRAYIYGAELRWANLRGANLRKAELRGANLREAELRKVKGFYLLPVQDPRGYSFPHAVEYDGVWRIRAGCRDLTVAEAREHWGESYAGERWVGDMYLYACDWLERRISGEAG